MTGDKYEAKARELRRQICGLDWLNDFVKMESVFAAALRQAAADAFARGVQNGACGCAIPMCAECEKRCEP